MTAKTFPTNQNIKPDDWVFLLKDQDKLTLEVNGDCMVGSINHGSRLTISQAKFYWPGDIVVFPKQQYLLVHRVIGLYKRHGITKIVTQADQRIRADKAIFYADIIGKVILIDDQRLTISIIKRIKSIMRFVYFGSIYSLRWSRSIVKNFY